jgi:hypothetical protein
MARPKEEMNRDRVNRTLQAIVEFKTCTRDELTLYLKDFTMEEVAAAVFELRKTGYVVIDGGEGKQTYRPTELGKRVCPPAYISNLSEYELAPKDRGYRHVHGVVGKIDFSKPLKGGALRLYESLSRPMTARQWFDAANMKPEQAWTYVRRLRDFGIIKEEKITLTEDGKEVSQYTRIKSMPAPQAAPAPTTIEDLFRSTAPTSPPSPITPAVSNFSKPNMVLDDCIAELQERFSLSDIMMATLVRMTDELNQASDAVKFRNQLLKTIPGEIA